MAAGRVAGVTGLLSRVICSGPLIWRRMAFFGSVVAVAALFDSGRLICNWGNFSRKVVVTIKKMRRIARISIRETTVIEGIFLRLV
jgi:hypothetical protein